MVKSNEQVELAFGIVLRDRRRALGLSQEKLAEAANLHRTYISQIERGMKSPSLNALLALARALQTLPHTLIQEMESGLTDV